ncbi:MAG: hypothetical protein ACI8V5_004839 [Limisphaerales bacterium]|jgi:hypothetical protein
MPSFRVFGFLRVKPVVRRIANVNVARVRDVSDCAHHPLFETAPTGLRSNRR